MTRQQDVTGTLSELAKSGDAESENNQQVLLQMATVQAQTGVTQPAGLTAGRVRQLTGAYIKPITRFSQADLQETSPEHQSRLVAILTCTQRVSISEHFDVYAGRISDGTIKVPTVADVQVNTKRLRDGALAELPACTSAWAALDSGEYRRLLPDAPFLSGFTTSYGYEFSCNGCSGGGQLTCKSCQGLRRTRCSVCSGTGHERCRSCNGDGRKRCNACNGQGSGFRWVWVNQWDSTTHMHVPVQKQVYRNCHCTLGYTVCNYCTLGKVQCSKCVGSRTNPCPKCHETGKTRCDLCLATGWLHKKGRLISQVSTDEALEIHHPDAAVVAQIKPRLNIPDLTKHTRLTSVRHMADGARITSIYQTDMLVTRASISAAGLEFSIYGFGPEFEIFDYQNIAGKLLEADVQALAAAIAKSSAWRIRGGNIVLEAARVFVESELNLLIAESVTQAHSAAAALVPVSVESKFKGLVDETYISRSSALFKLALGRIYQAQMAELGLYCTSIAVLATAATYGFSWPSRSLALPLGLATGVLSWVGAEIATRRRIRKYFPGTAGARMLAQINATGLPARLRGFALGAAVVGSFLTMWGINSLPHERRMQAEENSTKYLKAALSDWHSSSQADLRLRTYPALDTLRKSVPDFRFTGTLDGGRSPSRTTQTPSGRLSGGTGGVFGVMTIGVGSMHTHVNCAGIARPV